MAKRQQRRSRAEWERIVDGFEKSGLSQIKYAARARVSKHSLQYWIYKIRDERESGSVAITPAEPTVDFVEVCKQSFSKSGRPPLVVRVGNATLEFESPPSPSWLAVLINETSRPWPC